MLQLCLVSVYCTTAASCYIFSVDLFSGSVFSLLYRSLSFAQFASCTEVSPFIELHFIWERWLVLKLFRPRPATTRRIININHIWAGDHSPSPPPKHTHTHTPGRALEIEIVGVEALHFVWFSSGLGSRLSDVFDLFWHLHLFTIWK